MKTADVRPVWTLTVEELVKAIESSIGQNTVRSPVAHPSAQYIYGLEGIRKEFGVGHNTAQRLKDTVLRNAVLQAGPGCKVIVDLELARKLYREHKEREGLK